MDTITEITRLMILYVDNPSIPTYKFVRRSGVQCNMLDEPTLNELLYNRDITMAVAVVGTTPIFVGDAVLYHNGVCFISAVVEKLSEPFGEVVLKSASIKYYLTPKDAKIKLKLRSNFKYPTIELCGENVKRLSRIESLLYPHKCILAGSNDTLWADSMETIDKYSKYLQKVIKSFEAASESIFDV